eukprot:5696313-Pleurochrysis_carterae.AAC.2
MKQQSRHHSPRVPTLTRRSTRPLCNMASHEARRSCAALTLVVPRPAGDPAPLVLPAHCEVKARAAIGMTRRGQRRPGATEQGLECGRPLNEKT